MIKIETSLDWQDVAAAVSAVREASGWEGNNVKVFADSDYSGTKLVFHVTPPRRDEVKELPSEGPLFPEQENEVG